MMSFAFLIPPNKGEALLKPAADPFLFHEARLNLTGELAPTCS